jgi:hypothetical protein
MNNYKSPRSATGFDNAAQRLSSFDCMTGVTQGEPLAISAELLAAVTEWAADHEGKARFRRVRGRNGRFRVVLDAYIPEPCS